MGELVPNVSRIEQIDAQFKLCSIFVIMALSNQTVGDHEAARRSLANAENLYSIVLPLISDAERSAQLPTEKRLELALELKQLRKTLDELHQVP